MSSSIPATDPSPYKQAYAQLAPYVAPWVAGGGAIVLPFYGLCIKSAIQTSSEPCVGPAARAVAQVVQAIPKVGVKNAVDVFRKNIAAIADNVGIPRMTVRQAIREGISAAPTVSLIVGTQMATQGGIEKGVAWVFPQAGDTAQMVVSSAIVGAISVPFLAIFNGKTMKKSVVESLRGLSAVQSMAIVARETTFIASLRVNQLIERRYGKSKGVAIAAAAISGAVCGAIGHPFDTVLTLDQAKIKITSPKQLVRGIGTRSTTLGAFAVCYKVIGDAIKPSAE